jgi:hypothetical protein
LVRQLQPTPRSRYSVQVGPQPLRRPPQPTQRLHLATFPDQRIRRQHHQEILHRRCSERPSHQSKLQLPLRLLARTTSSPSPHQAPGLNSQRHCSERLPVPVPAHRTCSAPRLLLLSLQQRSQPHNLQALVCLVHSLQHSQVLLRLSRPFHSLLLLPRPPPIPHPNLRSLSPRLSQHSPAYLPLLPLLQLLLSPLHRLSRPRLLHQLPVQKRRRRISLAPHLLQQPQRDLHSSAARLLLLLPRHHLLPPPLQQPPRPHRHSVFKHRSLRVLLLQAQLPPHRLRTTSERLQPRHQLLRLSPLVLPRRLRAQRPHRSLG